MNPYQFSNPEIRAAAFGLARALEDFDTKATAALAACEQRIAASETSKGDAHEDQVATPLPIFGLCRPSSRHRPPPSLALILEGLRREPQGYVPSDDPTFLPADKMFWANARGGRLG